MLLEAVGIKKSFGSQAVLTGVDLALERGSTASVQGVSGCGKSTLLAILGLLERPTRGTVSVDGHTAAFDDDAAVSRLRADAFGFVFQHAQLVGSLRAIDNVLVASCFSFKGDKRERAWELLGEVGLQDHAHHYPHQLSVGQRRRVALARALLLDPPVIIADEPTNDLDPRNAETVAELLYGQAKLGRGVLVATHDACLARSCDTCYRLQGGRLVSAQDEKGDA